MMPRVSLIISVYKDVESLSVILDALRFQTYKDYEVIVSEDGEFEGMRTLLQEKPNIMHLTQPDEGWRKNRALNNAVRCSNGEYLVFIDGDCVPHHRFLENHVRLSCEKSVLAGRRVKLGRRYTGLFKDRTIVLPTLQRRTLLEFAAMREDGAKFYEEGIYVSPDSLAGRLLAKKKVRTIKGCNMSFYRKDIEFINGFDEDYVLPAVGEDVDLIWRFRAAGFKFQSVKHFALLYHLHHAENWNDHSINEEMMLQKMRTGEYVCRNGLSKHPQTKDRIIVP